MVNRCIYHKPLNFSKYFNGELVGRSIFSMNDAACALRRYTMCTRSLRKIDVKKSDQKNGVSESYRILRGAATSPVRSRLRGTSATTGRTSDILAPSGFFGDENGTSKSTKRSRRRSMVMCERSSAYVVTRPIGTVSTTMCMHTGVETTAIICLSRIRSSVRSRVAGT